LGASPGFLRVTVASAKTASLLRLADHSRHQVATEP
jgi:hypothetical protein